MPNAAPLVATKRHSGRKEACQCQGVPRLIPKMILSSDIIVQLSFKYSHNSALDYAGARLVLSK